MNHILYIMYLYKGTGTGRLYRMAASSLIALCNHGSAGVRLNHYYVFHDRQGKLILVIFEYTSNLYDSATYPILVVFLGFT